MCVCAHVKCTALSTWLSVRVQVLLTACCLLIAACLACCGLTSTLDSQGWCRVLLFSQMVRVLDIISDYMRMRGFVHQRLDGSTPAAARHQVLHTHLPGNSAAMSRAQVQGQVQASVYVSCLKQRGGGGGELKARHSPAV